MNKDRFKFVTLEYKETSKVYLVQRTKWELNEYYILLWEDETGEHDTGLGCYVWDIDEVEANIESGAWIIID
jgi:hypothetical protein